MSTPFRENALRQLSSPDQLDELMRVTDPRSWLALGTVGVVLLAALAWGVLGSIPDDVAGRGLLVRGEGLEAVAATGPGVLAEVTVGPGDEVRPGQVVAYLAQPQLAQRFAAARSVAEAEREHARRLAELARREAEASRARLEVERGALRITLDAAEREIAYLRPQLAARERAQAQGLFSLAEVEEVRQRLFTAERRLADARTGLRRLDGTGVELEKALQRELFDASQRAARAEQELAATRVEMGLSERVVSAVAGTVVGVRAEPGSQVLAGMPIVNVERTADRLRGILYVPPERGKEIRPGMVVQLSPATVKREEYGFLVGRVLEVSDFPATPQEMLNVLKNERLVDYLAGEAPPLAVTVELLPDRATTSGYRWSSRVGPPIPITSGTLATAKITVRRQSPLSLVFATVKRAVTG